MPNHSTNRQPHPPHPFQILMRWWWLPFLLIICSGAGAYFYQSWHTPAPPPAPATSPPPVRYQTSAILWYDPELVRYPTQPSINGATIHSPALLQEVITTLQLEMSISDLDQIVVVSFRHPPDPWAGTMIIEVNHQNPELAAAIANELARTFLRFDHTWRTEVHTQVVTRLLERMGQVQGAIAEHRIFIDAMSNTDTITDRIELDHTERRLAGYVRGYQRLFDAIEQQQLRLAQTRDAWQIVWNATVAPEVVPLVIPPAPMPEPEPSTIPGLFLAMMGGFGMGVVLAFAFESYYATLREHDHVRKISGYPILGTIREMATTTDGTLVTLSPNHTDAAEAYRMILATMGFSALHRPCHTILVTSSAPPEPAAPTAANLAVVLAQMGCRVILVDANLRQPSLHTLFGLAPTHGLETLSDSDHQTLAAESITALLCATKLETLRVLPCGPSLPPNAPMIVSTPPMVRILQVLREQADIVVMTSPSVGAAADASFLALLCDATLLAVHLGTTTRDSFQYAITQLSQPGIHVFGTIIYEIPAPPPK